MNSKPIDYIALTIAIVGTLNWGLIGFLNFNLVHFIFRSVMVDRIIYALVGLSGLYLLSTLRKNQGTWRRYVAKQAAS